MLDDIDYSGLHSSQKSAAPSQEEAPKKKTSVVSRSVVKKDTLERKQIDSEAVGQRAESLLGSMGSPEVDDAIAQYSLPAAGILAGLATAYGLYKAKQNTSFPTTSVPADQKGQSAIKSVEQNVAEAELLKPAYQRAGGVSPFDVQPTVPAEAKPLSGMDLLNERKRQIMEAAQQNAPVAPGPIQRQPISPFAGAPSFMAPGPKAPVIPTQPPSVSEAIASGENPSTSIQRDVAQMIDETPATGASEQTETKTTTKKGRPAGAKNLTAEARELKEAAKGVNMYRNMFGFQQSNPNSPQSLAAIEATNRFISEAFQGAVPGSRDPFLNPSTDVTAAGKKFYSGTPEGYRNKYIPWIEQNLHTLPPETQSHVLSSMTKGQTKDLTKIVKGLGLAGAALGAYETAFAKTPQERAMAGANLMGAILPPGADIGTAQAPGVEMTPDVYKLGSPYYESQEAKNYRQSRKVGSGRGIAPPSMYQR